MGNRGTRRNILFACVLTLLLAVDVLIMTWPKRERAPEAPPAASATVLPVAVAPAMPSATDEAAPIPMVVLDPPRVPIRTAPLPETTVDESPLPVEAPQVQTVLEDATPPPAASPERTVEPAPPPPELAIVRGRLENATGSMLRLTRISYYVDGAPVAVHQFGANEAARDLVIFTHEVAPGEHLLSVAIEYRGSAGPFSYFEGYRYKAQASRRFSTTLGLETEIVTVAFERGGPTVPFEKRLAISFR